MAKRNKQIDGQMYFDFCLDTSNYVVQSNELIGGKQALKLNSAKLIRSAIMQVVREDEELKPYVITIKELSDLIKVPASNLYRDIEAITDDIIKNPVYIREVKNGKTERFVKIPWVEWCEYKADTGVAIKLNERLKPFLLNLREHYAQYSLQEILVMKSVYAIRIYEILHEKVMGRAIPRNGTHVVLSVDELRECCGCENKYPAFGNFKDKVIDTAVREINRVTLYDLTFTYVKKGKSVMAIDFFVASKFRDNAYKGHTV